MRTARWVALAAVVLACATGRPVVERDASGTCGDSIRWKTLQLLLAGDLEGAGEYYLPATGASQLPRWLVAFQGAFNVANRVAGSCQKVADAIFEGFKRLEQSPALVTFTTETRTKAGAVIGFDLGDGKVVQVASNGWHVAVRCGDRIYDAYTGPSGMLVADYLARLIPGMQSYPIVMK